MHISNKYFPFARSKRKWLCLKITAKQLSGERDHDFTQNGDLDWSARYSWRSPGYRYPDGTTASRAEIEAWQERYLSHFDIYFGVKCPRYETRFKAGCPLTWDRGNLGDRRRIEWLYMNRQYDCWGGGAYQQANGAWHNHHRKGRRDWKRLMSRTHRRHESHEIHRVMIDPERDYLDPRYSDGYID